MLAHVRPMPNEQVRVCLVYGHAWIGYGHLYFVVYGDSIFLFDLYGYGDQISCLVEGI
jgi:hypothetical protein